MSDDEKYEEGWKAGYAKGLASGEAIGYSDGRYRTWKAIEVLKDTGAPAAQIRVFEEAVANIVGKLS